MSKKFELTQSESGKYHFHLKANNNQVILSSQMYKAKASALNGIESVQTNATDDGRYERKESKKGQPYFVLKAANGQVIGNSELYSSTAAMENGIASVKTNAPDAPIVDLTETASFSE